MADILVLWVSTETSPHLESLSGSLQTEPGHLPARSHGSMGFLTVTQPSVEGASYLFSPIRHSMLSVSL